MPDGVAAAITENDLADLIRTLCPSNEALVTLARRLSVPDVAPDLFGHVDGGAPATLAQNIASQLIASGATLSERRAALARELCHAQPGRRVDVHRALGLQPPPQAAADQASPERVAAAAADLGRIGVNCAAGVSVPARQDLRINLLTRLQQHSAHHALRHALGSVQSASGASTQGDIGALVDACIGLSAGQWAELIGALRGQPAVAKDLIEFATPLMAAARAAAESLVAAEGVARGARLHTDTPAFTGAALAGALGRRPGYQLTEGVGRAPMVAAANAVVLGGPGHGYTVLHTDQVRVEEALVAVETVLSEPAAGRALAPFVAAYGDSSVRNAQALGSQVRTVVRVAARAAANECTAPPHVVVSGQHFESPEDACAAFCAIAEGVARLCPDQPLWVLLAQASVEQADPDGPTDFANELKSLLQTR